MASKVKPIRNHDDKGNLISAGILYPQPASSILLGGFIILLLGSISAFLLFAGFVGFSTHKELSIAYFIGGLFFILITRKSYKLFGYSGDYHLAFNRDDKTTFHNNRYYPDFPPSQISNIQYREKPDVDRNITNRYEVMLLNIDGDIEALPALMSEERAIKVTTQLNKALSEIRTAIAMKTTVKDGVIHMDIDADLLDGIDPLAPRT